MYFKIRGLGTTTPMASSPQLFQLCTPISPSLPEALAPFLHLTHTCLCFKPACPAASQAGRARVPTSGLQAPCAGMSWCFFIFSPYGVNYQFFPKKNYC